MNLIKIYTFIIAIMTSSLCFTAQASDIPLYPTGPSQDSAFIRFINGTGKNLTVTAGGSKAKIALEVNKPVSPYYPVASKEKITGEFNDGTLTSSISLYVKAGEFTTAVAFTNGGTMKQVIFKEEPNDFNALKSSLAFYNQSSGECTQAGLVVTDRDVPLFEKVLSGTLKRRLINPVNISVKLICNGKSTGKILALGELQAGQRYSIFAVPDANNIRIFFATDTIAR